MVFNENGPKKKKKKTGRIQEFKVRAELHVQMFSRQSISECIQQSSGGVFYFSFYVFEKKKVIPCGLAFGWPPTAAEQSCCSQRPEASTARRPRRHQSKSAIGSLQPSDQITTIITQVSNNYQPQISYKYHRRVRVCYC